MPAPWEMDWSAQAAPPAAAAGDGAKPWEKDWGGEGAKPQQRGAVDKLLGLTGERYQLWPERLARGVGNAIVSGATLPRDVMEGKVNLDTPEGLTEAAKRGVDTVSLGMSPSVAARTGAQIARRAFSPGQPNPAFKAPTEGMRAAQTAADVGAPLPTGVISDNKGVQALTQAARQLPLVGGKIDEKIGATVAKAGDKVGELAEGLAGGVPDRAQAGANLRPSLQGVIEDNNSRIGQAYGALRNVIDPDKVAPLPRTRAALQGVLRERGAARMAKPEAGLADTMELAKNGASFDGLQRARADIGKQIGLAASNPNPGFNVGDFKRIYAAMSADMEGVTRAHALYDPNKAVDVLHFANKAADTLIDRNKGVQRLLNVQSDERLAGSVINAAQDKTGNARLLMQLRNQMPKADFEEIVGVGLSELGHNPTTGAFSLNKFVSGWNKMGDTAKSVLFPDPAHRKMLDDIANLGKVLKGGDQYANKSNTGRAASLSAILGAGAGAAVSLDPLKMLGVLGGIGGGAIMAKALAKPATASSIAKWLRAAELQRRSPSAGAQASLNLTTRNLLSNLESVPGFNRGDFVKRLEAPKAESDRDRGKDDAGGRQPARRNPPDRHPQ